LRRQFDRQIEAITPVDKIDLDMKNHLAGLKRTYLKVEFSTVQDLIACKSKLMPIVFENKERSELADAYAGEEEEEGGPADNNTKQSDSRGYSEFIEDMREYDVPYYTRVSIDRQARVGHWYQVSWKEGKITMEQNINIKNYAQPRILAFGTYKNAVLTLLKPAPDPRLLLSCVDIETTKLPLKFPDASIDQVMMISYMLDGQGFLITNREIVGDDIEDFEYTPDKEYPGPFHVWNEKDEKAVMERFVNHICETKPTIFVTYNGDFFDWKFLNERSKILKIPLSRSIGLRWDEQGEYFSTRFSCHLDCIRWVIRDSYLPQGSHGLKAVTKAKLKYDPLEVDPERMLEFARERPQHMASYSVSDAVATYYLYMKYIHTFVFSLCTIVPMHPDDVLRKGSGTLCEALLMVEAFNGEIIFPNKKGQPFGKLYEGHLIESETYVGGHVEALQVGVYRADLDTEFEVDSAELDTLINDADKILRFACLVEAEVDPSLCVNFEEVKENLIAQLTRMRDAAPHIKTTPLIYHVDVAAMYPNIILTNRLQPISIVDGT
jgi:DNA polymerase epsilon subunit 1